MPRSGINDLSILGSALPEVSAVRGRIVTRRPATASASRGCTPKGRSDTTRRFDKARLRVIAQPPARGRCLVSNFRDIVEACHVLPRRTAQTFVSVLGHETTTVDLDVGSPADLKARIRHRLPLPRIQHRHEIQHALP